jgi:tetratricopeptide (TPR) repeat protein
MKPITELRDAAVHGAERDIALFELGLALDRRGELTAGIAAVREAAALKPDEPYYHLGLSRLLARGTGSFEEAADHARRALALDPHSWKAAGALGWLLGTVLRRPAEGRPFMVRAIELNPEPRKVYESFCGTCLDEQGLDELRARVEGAAPPNARRDLLCEGLATALMHVGRYDEARRLLEDAVRVVPDHVLFLTALAEAEIALGDDEAASRHLERALQRAPSNPDVQDSYLSAAWRSGDPDRIAAAIAAVQIATSGAPGSTRSDTQSSSLPADEAVRGKTILLTEKTNGYGDVIQGARMAALLQARGARAMLECKQPLRTLFETARGVSGVVVPHDVYPPHDQACYPFGLLPSLRWTWEELSRVPYFDLPRPLLRTWAERVHAGGGGVRVGLAWRSGDELTLRDNPYRRRTIPLSQLESLITLPGTTCHALNYGESVSREVAGFTAAPLSDLATRQADFIDTAAIVCALDIVVTVDAAVAHLAGALAKPTLLMLPYHADGRWGQRGTVLGYPTIQTFRQPAPGDWAPVIASARDALNTFVREQPQQGLVHA